MPLVLPLYFISDVFLRLDDSSVLAQIGNLFPIRHLSNVLQSVWNPVLYPFDPVDLVWIAAWGVLGWWSRCARSRGSHALETALAGSRGMLASDAHAHATAHGAEAPR